MWPNPQFPEDLVTFTEEILNGKLHFLRSDRVIYEISPMLKTKFCNLFQTVTLKTKIKLKSFAEITILSEKLKK